MRSAALIRSLAHSLTPELVGQSPEAFVYGMHASISFRFNPQCADMTIMVGATMIRCHKFMLSARSVYFRSLLHSDMKESQSSTIAIEDACPQLMKMIIRCDHETTEKR